MVVRKLGPFELEHAQLRINRGPQVTVEVTWTPAAEQRRHKEELMRGGPYEVSIPTGESWTVTPEQWQDGPGDEVAVTLRSIRPEPHGPGGSFFSLTMEAGASEAEKRAVSVAFRSIGYEPGDIGMYERRSLGDHPWLIMASGSLAIFLKSFLEQAGHRAGDALSDFIKRLVEARRSPKKPNGQIVFIDEDSGLWIPIPTELPLEACQKLMELDLSQLGEQYQALVYNQETGEWELH